jgi:hypothetical protein
MVLDISRTQMKERSPMTVEAAHDEAHAMQEKVQSGQAENYFEAAQQLRLASHTEQLASYGLHGLEGRLLRGLDPAGMLAVSETRQKAEELFRAAGIDLQGTEELTKALHVGAIWEKAEDLAAADKPEVRGWMYLADECHEVNDHDLAPGGYLADVDRIERDMEGAMKDPAGAIEIAVENIVGKAKQKYGQKQGVAFSEADAFLHMAIGGERFGVCKAGELYFAGARKLDYDMLADEGLTVTEREDRGRRATLYQRDGVDVVKKLYDGLAIIFGDEALALRLAKSAQKYL